MNRCSYCNKKSENLIPVTVEADKKKETFYCDTEACKEKTISFFRFAYGKGKIPAFIAILSISMLLIMFGSIFNHWLTLAGAVLLGLDILIFPFGTPQTFSWLGIKKAILVVRLLGIAIIAINLLLFLLV